MFKIFEFRESASDLGAKLGGDHRIIEPDFLLDNASVPDGVKIEPAWPLNGDEVSAAVIVKRQMQRLMNVADPMTEAFEEPELIAHVETKSKIARVVQDSRDDATIGERARTLGFDAFCRALQIDIMLGRSLTWKDVGPRASVGKGAELGVDRHKRIDTSFDFGFQFLISDLADDAVSEIAPRESGEGIVKGGGAAKLAFERRRGGGTVVPPSVPPSKTDSAIKGLKKEWLPGPDSNQRPSG